MNNKGTQALFKSDVSVIRSIVGREVSISVSTTDIEGVKRLNLSLEAILPPAVDVPYEKADQLVKKLRVGRKGVRYASFMIAMLYAMYVQAVLTIFSILLIKAGLGAPYRKETLKHVRDCDLVISHSDENFKESASLLPLNPYWAVTWWSMLISRTMEILVAKSFGKSVIMFPNSVGPFRTWVGRFLARLSLNSCDHVLIRDPISYEIVSHLGIRSAKTLTFDTALLFDTADKSNLDNFSRPLMGVSPGIYARALSQGEIHKYIMAHAWALDAAIERFGFFVVLMPHYVSGFHFDDMEISKLIKDNMKNRDKVQIVSTSGVDEFKRLANRMDIILSSKMHPAILGASGYVPILCVAYDHKQTGFFQRLDMVDCIVDIREISSQSLFSKIEYVWIRRKQLKESLENKIPACQSHLRRTLKKIIAPYVERYDIEGSESSRLP
jgi:polysaccharide pyruvyl transferase WcaK-like protein